MRLLKLLLLALLFSVSCTGKTLDVIHVWEKQVLTFNAENHYNNAYTDVIVWIDLVGPGFNKRVYGFWDGGQTFHLNLVATQPGTWKWKSGSNHPGDSGLSGKSGAFIAKDWTEAEKTANPLRRGFVRSTPNKHALEYADGTPFFAIGDTWYAAGTNRLFWYDDDVERPIGPKAGFKDYVRYRKSQGYNWVNVIAAFPNWITDDKPWRLVMDDSARTTIRSAWLEFGTGSAKNMDNEGGRPFVFPGKVPGYEDEFPDMDRINPEYFKYVDRKINYLNANGFVPFIEVSRRDASMAWFKYYGADSYMRFMQYIFSRYQANNVVLSPVHLDIISQTVSPDDFSAVIKTREEKYGPLPFGTLLSSNANPSTLENWGEDSWVTLHQTGNMREHNNYWYLTEIYNLKDPKPALNGEPYYAGYKDERGLGGAGYRYGADGGTERDNAFVRSSMYGSFLSGGLGGHVYGAEGIWGADIEPIAPIHMWDAFQWPSGAQMQHLRTFAFSIGKRYQELEPLADLVSPNKTHDIHSYEGWAYCARTPDKQIFMAFFEMGCPSSQIRGAKLNSIYGAQWFNPRNGTWLDVGDGKLVANKIGMIRIPDFPTDEDWGLRLIYEGTATGRERR